MEAFSEKCTSTTWGGARLGAGRKPSEASKRISVPIGCLDDVLGLIAQYKEGNSSQSEHVRVAPAAIVPDCEELSTDKKSPRTGNTGGTYDIDDSLTRSYEDLMVRRRSLNRLKGQKKKKLMVTYGSLQEAAAKGIYLSDDGVLKKIHFDFG